MPYRNLRFYLFFFRMNDVFTTVAFLSVWSRPVLRSLPIVQTHQILQHGCREHVQFGSLTDKLILQNISFDGIQHQMYRCMRIVYEFGKDTRKHSAFI